jgi:hypothetical protein
MKSEHILSLCFASLISAAAGAGEPTYKHSSCMPASFTNLFIGMTHVDFAKVRPYAQKERSLTDSLADFPVLYVEELNGYEWDNVRYSFLLGELGRVAFVKHADFDDPDLLTKRHTFLDRCLDRYGAEPSCLVRVVRSHRVPVLLWKRGGIKVFATFPIDHPTGPREPCFFQLVIADENSTEADNIVRVTSMTQAEIDAFFVEHARLAAMPLMYSA